MAKRLLLRKGTTAQHSTFTGGLAEITVDTDKDTLVVHNGSTVGGFPLARQSSISNIDNTADADKVVNSASKLTTARTVSISGFCSGSAVFDGTTNVDIQTTVTAIDCGEIL